jgi:hypothetical protein
MCDNVVHRVYVVEKGAKPHEVVGVITPTDILALVAGLGSWGKRDGASKRAGGGSSRAEECKKAKMEGEAADEAAES